MIDTYKNIEELQIVNAYIYNIRQKLKTLRHLHNISKMLYFITQKNFYLFKKKLNSNLYWKFILLNSIMALNLTDFMVKIKIATIKSTILRNLLSKIVSLRKYIQCNMLGC